MNGEQTNTREALATEQETFQGIPVRAPRALTEQFRRVPIAKLVEPRDGLNQVYRNFWWHVTSDDEVLFYQFGTRRYSYGSPQCNQNESVVRCMPLQGCTARQIPIICTPHECES